MTVVSIPLTNSAYGFPRGAGRRVKPTALACVHITGNAKTAAYPDLHAAARGERNYANRDGSNGPSAHIYAARDGWAIQAINWRRYAAWSNGDVASPNTANPGIRRALALRAKGYNLNEAFWLEFENLGYGSTYPITAAQKQLDAELIAEAARHSGLPVNRETVVGHWEINGVDRRNCPAPYAQREAFLRDIIRRANDLLTPEVPDVPGLDFALLATVDDDPFDAIGTAKLGTDARIRVIRTRDMGLVDLADGADLGIVQRGALSSDQSIGGVVRPKGTELAVFNHEGRAHAALWPDIAGSFVPLPKPVVDRAAIVADFRARAAAAAAEAASAAVKGEEA